MSFYDPIALDPTGGFFQRFRDDGTIYDRSTRSLIASARFVFNYAMAYRQFGTPDYLARVRHGLDYLRRAHRNPATGGYAWQIIDGRPADTTNHCYGLAFVLLAYACAARTGIAEARGWIDETFEVMERHFWLADDGLYANEADAGWVLSDYRGQNDNMHSCEALIACWEATGGRKFLQRAALIAENITVRQAALAGGEVWEHYRRDWSLDLDFAKGEQQRQPAQALGGANRPPDRVGEIAADPGPPPAGRVAPAARRRVVRPGLGVRLGRRARGAGGTATTWTGMFRTR